MAQDTMYLTVDRDREVGGMIAVISMGSPQHGDTNVAILSVERVKNRKEAKAWYRRMKVERPWETRQ
jgi:hypothetical protein